MHPRALLIAAFLASPAHADELRYLENGKTALADLYTKIRDADTGIDMHYYIFATCDPLGRVILRELADKVERMRKEDKTFRARILIDASTVEEPYRRSLSAYYGKLGIDIRYFNRETSRTNPQSNFRSHLKLTIADGKTFVSGGRNIESDYYGLSGYLNWIDRDVSVEGPEAATAQRNFDEIWKDSISFKELPPDPERLGSDTKRCFEPWGEREKEIDNFLKRNSDRILAGVPRYSCPDVHYIMDRTVGYSYVLRIKTQPTTASLIQMLAAAEKSITLENYSYLPSSDVKGALEKQRAKIPIEIYTNNFHFSNEPVTWANYENSVKDNKQLESVYQLSRFGSMRSSWELTPEGSTFMIHSKVYVTDGKDAAVTTENIDPRSYHSNLESAVLVRGCPEFAAKVEGSIKDLKKYFDADEQEPCLRLPGPEPGLLDRIYLKMIEQLL